MVFQSSSRNVPGSPLGAPVAVTPSAPSPPAHAPTPTGVAVVRVGPAERLNLPVSLHLKTKNRKIMQMLAI